MKPTPCLTAATIIVIALATLTSLTSRATTPVTPPGATNTDARLERGKYLVENVGLCADCHTPRLPTGEFDRTRWLLGAALPFQPTVPMPWSPAAPPIAGLPSMTEAQAVSFLQTATRPDGTMPRPPMPPFRFSPEDADAVVGYLKSLAK